jgi:hypothetical protein
MDHSSAASAQVKVVRRFIISPLYFFTLWCIHAEMNLLSPFYTVGGFQSSYNCFYVLFHETYTLLRIIEWPYFSVSLSSTCFSSDIAYWVCVKSSVGGSKLKLKNGINVSYIGSVLSSLQMQLSSKLALSKLRF